MARHVPSDKTLSILEEDKRRWAWTLRNIGSITKGELQATSRVAKMNAMTAQRTVARQQVHEFEGWVVDAMEKAPRKVFSWLKGQHTNEQIVVDHGKVAVSLEERLETKKRSWDKKLDKPLDMAELQATLEEAKRRAKEKPLPKITVEEVRRALATQPNSKGRGSENLGPLDIKRLPAQAVEELTEVFNEWEEQQALPWQVLPALVNLGKNPMEMTGHWACCHGCTDYILRQGRLISVSGPQGWRGRGMLHSRGAQLCGSLLQGS